MGEALSVLAVAHYLLAAVTLLAAPVGLYLVFAGWPLLYPESGTQTLPHRRAEILDPPLWGATFVVAGVLLTSLSLMHAGLLAYVGRLIARRKRRRFCLVFSVLDMTYLPLGTALGIFALWLLTKQPVKAQFDAEAKARA